MAAFYDDPQWKALNQRSSLTGLTPGDFKAGQTYSSGRPSEYTFTQDGKQKYYVPDQFSASQGFVGNTTGMSGGTSVTLPWDKGSGLNNLADWNNNPNYINPRGRVFDTDPNANAGATVSQVGTGGFTGMDDLYRPLMVGVGGPLLGAGISSVVGAPTVAGAGAGTAAASDAGMLANLADVPAAGGAGAGGAAAAGGAGASDAALASLGFPAGTGAGAVPVGTAENAFAGLSAAEAGNVAGAAGYTAPQLGFEAGLSGAAAENVAGLAGAGGGAGAGAAEGGSSILGTIGSAAKDFMSSKLAIPALATAGSLFLGRQKIPEADALKANQALQGAGLQGIQTAQAGNVTPAQQAQIDRWQSDQISQASQFLSNAGMGGIHKDPKTGAWTADSTAGLEMLGKIQQGAIALKQGFADQLFNQSMQELGVSDTATQNLINLKLRQQQQTGQALSSFLLAYGMLGGWGAA